MVGRLEKLTGTLGTVRFSEQGEKHVDSLQPPSQQKQLTFWGYPTLFPIRQLTCSSIVFLFVCLFVCQQSSVLSWRTHLFCFLGSLRTYEWDLWLLQRYADGFRGVILILPEPVCKHIRMHISLGKWYIALIRFLKKYVTPKL